MTTNNERLEAIKRLKAERENPTVPARRAKGVPPARMYVSGKRYPSAARWKTRGRYHTA